MTLAAICITSLCVLVGCSPPTQPAPTAPTKDVPPTTEAAPTTAKVEASAAPAPRSREPAPTPQAALGAKTTGLGLEVGAQAPIVQIHDSEGKPVSTDAVFGKEAVLVVFYRGGWCPYCNAQLHGLSQRFAELRERGLTVAAVSVDKADEAAKTRASWQVPFHLWSDPDLALHEAFRVVHQTDTAEQERLKGFGIDLEASSGRSHRKFAVPGLFLIDRAGVVRWSHVDPDYKVRPTFDQLLGVIDVAFRE